MGFLNPVFLFGMMATAIPLLIHLWHRRQAKNIVFSSLMFLTLAHKQTARRIQLYNLLVLVLRMMIIALITLALCRPLLKNNVFFVGHRTNTSCVIILDHSYSMGYRDIDGQRFSIAQEKATEVINSLKNGDEATVILMSDIASAIFRQLTTDLRSVRTAIQQAKLTYRTTNITPSLDLAHEILAQSNNHNREIYLITDLAGWKQTQPIANRSGSKIFILPIGQHLAENLGLSKVAKNTPLVAVDLPIQIEAQVSNFTNARLGQTSVQFFLNEQKRRQLQLPNESKNLLSVGFTHAFETIGTHLGYLELPPDRLETDNRRYVVFDVYGQIKTLCVVDQSLYLLTALNPSLFLPTTLSTNITDTQISTTIQPSIIKPSEITTVSVKDWDLLLLADLETFSAEMIQQLQSFLRAGKSVILFTGSNLNFGNELEDWLGVSFSGNITWKPRAQIVLQKEQHPVFAPFLATDFSGDSVPQFSRSSNLLLNKSAQVLAYLENHQKRVPFLVEYRPETKSGLNKGTVLVFNTSSYLLTDANLLITPYFLPLIQQSILYIKSREKTIDRQLVVSQPFKLDVGALANRVEITKPDSLEPVTIESDGAIHFNQTDQPGFYQVDVYFEESKERQFFTVNVSPTESDLRPIDLEEAKARISAQVLGKEQELGEKLNTSRTGREIWGELLGLALLLFGIESLLVNRNQKS